MARQPCSAPLYIVILAHRMEISKWLQINILENYLGQYLPCRQCLVKIVHACGTELIDVGCRLRGVSPITQQSSGAAECTNCPTNGS
jgi:hypothetical protein